MPTHSTLRGALLRPVRELKRRRECRAAVLQGRAHPLTAAKVGESLVIIGVAGEHSFDIPACFDEEFAVDAPTRRRVMEMGFIPGACVKILNASDPLLLCLFGSRTAVSRSLAQSIFVRPVSHCGKQTCRSWRTQNTA